MKPRIVVVGSSNTDMIVQCDRIPRPGETVLGGRFVTAAGGKGANQAVAAARAGGVVSFVARVGSDTLGEEAVAGFRRDGVDVRHVTVDPQARSGVALIMVSAAGENSIAVAPGANARLTPKDIQKARKAIEGADILVMQLETPLNTVAAAARVASRAGRPVILNPAPAQQLPPGLLKDVTVLTPNESEVELLTGIQVRDESSASRAANKLLRQGVHSVVITLGERGAFAASGSTRDLVPTLKVKPVDTTAAGDVFNGALAVALAEGRALVEAVRFANAAAAISVTRLGAQPSAPKREEIERMLARRVRG